MRSTLGQKAWASVRLMKPGPAISTFSTNGSEASSGTMRSASSRGFLPAALARTMAALVARSPWEASLGGSSVMPSMLASCGTTPSCLSCCTAARTCPWNPAKTSMKAPGKTYLSMILSENRCPLFRIMLARRLTQIGSGVKQAPVLDKRVAVGHAGDEIGDVAGIAARAGLGCLIAPLGREGGLVLAIAREKLGHDPFGVAHDAVYTRGAVDARGEEGAQQIELALHRRRERDDRLLRVAHVVGALWIERDKPSPRLGGDVVDHRGHEASERLIKKPRPVDAGMGGVQLIKRARGDRHLDEIGEGEEGGTVAVIDVVVVIGDVVGERGDLSLDRRISGKLEILPRAISKDRLGHGLTGVGPKQ